MIAIIICLLWATQRITTIIANIALALVLEELQRNLEEENHQNDGQVNSGPAGTVQTVSS